MRTRFDFKSFQVQFNVISGDTQGDAPLHSENYRNLVVKVAG